MAASTTPPPTSGTRRRAPAWKRRLLLLLLLGCVGGSVLFYWAFTAPGRYLDDAFKEADRVDPGWRFDDIESRRQVYADERNSALVVLNMRGLLPKNWLSNDDEVLLERSLDEIESVQQLNQQQIKRLRDDRGKFELALTEGKKLRGLNHGRYPVQWRPMISGSITHSMEARPVALLVYRDALLTAQDGDIDDAVGSCIAVFNVSRSIGDEPLLISQLTRTSIRQQALRLTERVLAQGEAKEPVLAELQNAFAADLDYPAQLVALRGDRAVSDNAMEAVQNGQLTMRQLVGKVSQGDVNFTDVSDRIREGSPGYQRACLLQFNTRCIEVAKLPPHEQPAKLKELLGSLDDLPAVVRLLIPGVISITNSFHSQDAELRCAVVAVAVERYRRRHGRWPAKLDDLVPEFLPALPNDPFTGRPLHYRTTEDGVMIWSVGVDGQDDNGRVDRALARHLKGQDLRFRLWNPDRRRQAPPAEVPVAP